MTSCLLICLSYLRETERKLSLISDVSHNNKFAHAN